MPKDPYASLKHGLVGAWIPSISGSGLLLPDLSGRGNNGVLTGMDASDWVSSQYGRALDFDGSNDWVLMQGARSVYDVGTGDFSLFSWFRSTAAGTQSIFLLDNNSTGNGLILFSQGNILRTWVAGLRTDSTTVINDGAWKHVGMVRRSGLVTQFINGISGNTFTSTGSALTGQTPRIGSYDGSNFMLTGQVDDARFYSRALTESEIKLLASDRGIGFKPARKLSFFSKRYTYQPPKAKVFEGVRVRDHDYASLRQGLVGAWCPSLPNGGSGNILPDQSGRGNNGTLTNMGPEDWVASEGGRALDFDGVNDYVATNTELTSQFGISYWFNRRTGGTFGSRISWGNTVDGDVYAGNIGSNFVGVQSNDSGTVKTFQGFTINNNTWYHLIINRDESNNVRVYLNTIQSTSGAQSVAGTFTLNGLGRYSNAIGGNAPFQWDGMLDDIRTYNRALTEAEIRLLASKRGIGLQPSPTRFIAKEKKTGLRRRILTGQT